MQCMPQHQSNLYSKLCLVWMKYYTIYVEKTRMTLSMKTRYMNMIKYRVTTQSIPNIIYKSELYPYISKKLPIPSLLKYRFLMWTMDILILQDLITKVHC